MLRTHEATIRCLESEREYKEAAQRGRNSALAELEVERSAPTAPDLLAVVKLKLERMIDKEVKGENDPSYGAALCDCHRMVCDVLTPRRVRVVEGVLDLYEPLSGKHSRTESDTITVFEPIKRGTPVKVLIEESEDV